MNKLKITLLLIVTSSIFISCNGDDDNSPIVIPVTPVMNIKIENTGTDMIESLKVQTIDQTITLNQFAINTPTSNYLISNLNANSVLLVTFENTTGTSIAQELIFGDIGNYKLDVVATSNFSDTSVSLNEE